MNDYQTLLLILAFATTIAFCALSFRSLVAGIILIIPLAISNLLVFAYMALRDIGLTVNTLPVASIAVGIGVDYGIYLLGRIKEEYPRHSDWESVISMAVNTTGKAIALTGATVMLGAIFWYFSSIRFQAEMGLLLCLATFFHLLGTLIFLPALVLIWQPKFLKGGVVKG